MDEQRKDIAFRDNLKKQIEALAKNDYKSTDVLLDAAKSQDDGQPAFSLDALKSR